MDSSSLGYFAHGISQARILEWVVISFSYSEDRNMKIKEGLGT